MNRFFALIGLAITGSVWAQATQLPPPSFKPSLITASADRAQMLGIDCAGKRAVVVGERGTVLLAYAGNMQWRQARTVPVDVLLTSTSFADDRQGWAVGHWGVILHTEDGGETWQKQRDGLPQDRPLFSVHFFDREVGVAVGLWNLILRTVDGGRHWQAIELTGDKKTDASLFALFEDSHSNLYAVGERGMLLRSQDRGISWQPVPTGHVGSLWAGISAKATGTLIVAGLRGAVLRSADNGKSWVRVPLTGSDSITALSTLDDGRLVAVGAEGHVWVSADDGKSFSLRRRPDRIALNGLAPSRCDQGSTSLLAATAQGPAYLNLEQKE